MKPFNILALDSNYQIVQIVSFTSLQWSRKWHESGTFSIQVPIGQYSNNWKYIYTKDRPEVGLISQINYISENGFNMVVISGYFLEKELDRMICYSPNHSIDRRDLWSEPSMSNIYEFNANFEHFEGSADQVALKYFNGFKKIDFYDYTGYDQATLKHFELDILQGTIEAGTYRTADHYRNNEKLGYKCYDILKPTGASYRVRLDFDQMKKYFDILHGKDKTQDNTEGNNPIVFSTKYGNVTNPNIVISNNEYIDCVITNAEYSIKRVGTNKTENFVSVNAKCTSDAIGVFDFVNSTINVSDYKISDEQETSTQPLDDCYNTLNYKRDVANELASELKGMNVQTINIEFDSSAGSYEYRDDFDIGDLVSLEIPEIELSADVRLIGCYETISDGKWNLSMEFGTPILKN